MDVMCSICQCTLSRLPPEDSTPLADLCEYLKAPVFNVSRPKTGSGDDYPSEPSVVATPCGHLFHSSCITQWFLMIGHRRCPLCNLITQVHQMLPVYLSIQQSSVQSQPRSSLSCTCTNEEEKFADNELPSTSLFASVGPGLGTITATTNLLEDGGNTNVAAGTELADVETEIPIILCPPVTGTSMPTTSAALQTDTDITNDNNNRDLTSVPASQSIVSSSPCPSQPSTSTSLITETDVPFQMVETFINGIRTMVYHFNNGRESASDEYYQHQLLTTDFGMDRPGARETIRRQQRSEFPRSALSRTCTRCADLSRIQALMTSDLRDLHNLAIDQMTRLETLTEAIENRSQEKVMDSAQDDMPQQNENEQN